MFTKQRGYLALPTPDGDKWMHFSINFIANLQELTGENLHTWGGKLKTKDELETGLAICELMYASLAAFDQEENNDIDYNIYKVRNWGIEAMNNDKDLAKNILEALESSLGKPKGAKKAKAKKAPQKSST